MYMAVVRTYIRQLGNIGTRAYWFMQPLVDTTVGADDRWCKHPLVLTASGAHGLLVHTVIGAHSWLIYEPTDAHGIPYAQPL